MAFLLARPGQHRRDANWIRFYFFVISSSRIQRHDTQTRRPFRQNWIKFALRRCQKLLPHTHTQRERQTKAKLSASKRKNLENTHTHTQTQTVAHTHRDWLAAALRCKAFAKEAGCLALCVPDSRSFVAELLLVKVRRLLSSARFGSARHGSAGLGSAQLVNALRMRWICVMETHFAYFACILLIRNVAVPHQPVLVEAPKRKLAWCVLYILGSDEFLD